MWRFGTLSRRRRLLVIAAAVAAAALVCLLVVFLTLPDVERLVRTNPETTAFIELRRETARDEGRPFKLRWRWRRLNEISPYLRHAVIHAEDARFWDHEGIDWEAVKQAAERDWEEKSLGHGASTITQQVAKNLFLSPSRNPLRKVRELLIARRLERTLSKRRLLEIYLNIAEWGDGVFGAEAAAQRWFRRSASQLTPGQAARLAVALPNPFLYSPDRRSKTLDRKTERLLRAMRRDGLLGPAVTAAVAGTPTAATPAASAAAAAPPAAKPATDEAAAEAGAAEPAEPASSDELPAAAVPASPAPAEPSDPPDQPE
jgi:monofunctional biosynthetic peptidoglycan transglycosylase